MARIPTIRMQSRMARRHVRRAGLETATTRRHAPVRAARRWSRHLHWVSAIVRRFTTPSARWGFRPQAFVHLRRARTAAGFVRTVATSRNVTARVERSLVAERRSILERIITAVSRSAPALLDRHAAAAPAWIRARTRRRAPVESRRTVLVPGPHTANARVLPVAPGATLGRTGVSPTALTSLPVVACRRLRLVTQAADLPTQMARRLRRREEMPPIAPRAPLPSRAADAEPLSRTVVARGTLPPRRQSPSLEPASPPVARPTPAVSVTQITDEVIRQLDRRFVAARERLGNR